MELRVTEWRRKSDKEGNIKLAGSYAIMLGTKEVARQVFNDDYSSLPVLFSKELMDKLKELDAIVAKEIKDNFTE